MILGVAQVADEVKDGCRCRQSPGADHCLHSSINDAQENPGTLEDPLSKERMLWAIRVVEKIKEKGNSREMQNKL